MKMMLTVLIRYICIIIVSITAVFGLKGSVMFHFHHI